MMRSRPSESLLYSKVNSAFVLLPLGSVSQYWPIAVAVSSSSVSNLASEGLNVQSAMHRQAGQAPADTTLHRTTLKIAKPR